MPKLPPAVKPGVLRLHWQGAETLLLHWVCGSSHKQEGSSAKCQAIGSCMLLEDTML